MKKLAFILILIGAFSFNTIAQNEVDALRYSQNYYVGTARAFGMGGSFGSLGADFSSLSTNPAGIGIYANNEFSVSPSLFLSVKQSDFLGSKTDDRKANLNLGNLGVVFVVKPKKESSIKGIQFGIGFNRLNNYNFNGYTSGYNSINSMVNDFKLNAQGSKPDALNQFSEELAFNTYLIDTTGSLTNYFSTVPKGGTLQNHMLETRGSSNELVLSLGCNVNEKFYIGATLGFPYVRYVEDSYYEEKDEADTINDFKSMQYNRYLETRGTGFNFKLGFIYRPADWVRLGAAIHTPTFFSMNDKWNSEMFSEFDNGDKFNDESPKGQFDYRLNTPLRANASLSFIIGKHALITGEYELADYSSARLRSDTYRFVDENKAIDNKYALQSNIRAGAEVKIKSFAVRAGYTYSSSPYVKRINDGKRQSIHGGVGVKFDRFYLDAAYAYSFLKENYYIYATVPDPVMNKMNTHTAVISFGLKF